jgi:hypothetical protein
MPVSIVQCVYDTAYLFSIFHDLSHLPSLLVPFNEVTLRHVWDIDIGIGMFTAILSA